MPNPFATGDSQEKKAVEDSLHRIQEFPQVVRTMVYESKTNPAFSTVAKELDRSAALVPVNLLKELVDLSEAFVRDINPTTDLKIIRIRGKKNAIFFTFENGNMVYASMKQPLKIVKSAAQL